MRKLLFILPLISSFPGFAQDSSRLRLNTIKVHLVSSFLYSNSAALSYERVSKPYQSWAVMAGFVQFPNLGNLGSTVHVKDIKSNTGYVVGGEYRFYLKKENKHQAPHGVYIGPYVNFFNFRNERTLSHTSSSGTHEANLNTNVQVLNIGAQLGYQFVIKDRWTFDLIFIGPSLSNYRLKANLDGNFDLSEEEILNNELLAALTDRFPAIKDLLGKEAVDIKETSSKWSGGFRYQMNIGYRFGRGRKH